MGNNDSVILLLTSYKSTLTTGKKVGCLNGRGKKLLGSLQIRFHADFPFYSVLLFPSFFHRFASFPPISNKLNKLKLISKDARSADFTTAFPLPRDRNFLDKGWKPSLMIFRKWYNGDLKAINARCSITLYMWAQCTLECTWSINQ